ncbi:interleukin-25 isoform X2 [Hemicordylus capensis]|nr:interleukin-25 isoform X2 [Hemicordylus capensis]XP_053121118.1 interleukin-25 isoform X2 [Hemicordylus capensis]
MCFMFSAFLPCQALHCLTQCCSETEVNRVGERLVSGIHKPQIKATNSYPASECWASSEGDYGQRSVSPWRYTLDHNPNRYPQYIRQAYCACPSCISLANGTHHGRKRRYSREQPNGNSVIISYSTLVFYREPCGKGDQFLLRPSLETVNVSCACVAAQRW